MHQVRESIDFNYFPGKLVFIKNQDKGNLVIFLSS